MLYYLTFTTLPTGRAFGYGIARRCSSLATQTPVTLVMARAKRQTTSEDIFSYYNLPTNFTVRTLPTIDLFHLTFLGPYIPFFVRKVSFFFSTLFLLRINRGDVCYSRDIWVLILLRLKTRRLFLESHYLTTMDILSLRVFPVIRKIVVITNFLKTRFISLGYNSADILVAPSGVDLSDFEKLKNSKSELRRKLDLPTDYKIISYIGKYKTMGEAKGVEILIGVFRSLVGWFPGTFLLLVGIDEAEQKEVNALFSSFQIPSDRYRIVLHVKHTLALEYMVASDTLVMYYPNLSHYAHVMSPLKLFEYMASGVPIVSSDLPSVREVLNSDEAFFCRADDPEALGQSLSEVLLHPVEAVAVAKKATKKAEAYTWDKLSGKILTFIYENS